MPHETGFKMFLSVWNRAQGQATPALHFRMAEWLERSWTEGQTRLLLQAFRSSGKSTVAGLFAGWLLYRNPALRIMVIGADLMLARKMVRNVRKIIERHPLTAHMKPARADQWGADRFTVNRECELRDPSMMARGIETNVTGSRADVIICDDVEVPNTCDTADKRAVLRERLIENDFVLVPGGSLLYLGTPHSWHSIYARKSCKEAGESAPFLEGFERLEIPLVDGQGRSAWPQRFSQDDIARIRKAAGPARFASQMMLTPVNIAESRLDPAALRFYGGQPYRDEIDGGLYLEGRRLISCRAWWDPAFGRGGDASVLAILFADGEGQYFLQRVLYIGVPDDAAAIDEATHQSRIVAEAARALFVPCVTVEINGIGRFLPAILRRELAQLRVPCTVQEVSSTRPKDLRILESFDAVLAARALYAHDMVKDTPFLTEMREWKPGRTSGRDDGLDAVAGALSLEPVRLKHERFAGRQDWPGARGAHEAKTDFEI